MFSTEKLATVQHAVRSVGKIEFQDDKLLALSLITGALENDDFYQLLTNAWNDLPGLLEALSDAQEELRRTKQIVSDVFADFHGTMSRTQSEMAQLMDSCDWWQARAPQRYQA